MVWEPKIHNVSRFSIKSLKVPFKINGMGTKIQLSQVLQNNLRASNEIVVNGLANHKAPFTGQDKLFGASSSNPLLPAVLLHLSVVFLAKDVKPLPGDLPNTKGTEARVIFNAI